MTLVALEGAFGFGKIVGVAEYFLNEASNMAEISLVVGKGFKRRGLGKFLLKKLLNTARQRQINGFIAYTSSDNRAMINLFKTLPYQTFTTFEDHMIVLTCQFEPIE